MLMAGFSEITLSRDHRSDLRFNGRLRAQVSSAREGAMRWTDLTLYEAQDGRLIINRIGRSTRPREVDRHAVYIVSNTDELIDALSRYGDLGWLSKRLLDEAGIDVAETL